MPTPGTVIIWKRRTHRLVAATIIFIGLTMLVSNITLCVYSGMVFIVLALLWLARMKMTERKTQLMPPPQVHQSPVLFFVTSSVMPRTQIGPKAHDKPPSYDQIISQDGPPPEYSSLQDKFPNQNTELAEATKVSEVAIHVEDTDESNQFNGSDNNDDYGRSNSRSNRAASEVGTTGAEAVLNQSRSSQGLWNAFTRGIKASRSFSLPRNYSGRNRHPSSTSSVESSLKPENSPKLLKLRVPTLQQDLSSSSKYLNTSFDNSESSFSDNTTCAKSQATAGVHSMARKHTLNSLSSIDSCTDNVTINFKSSDDTSDSTENKS